MPLTLDQLTAAPRQVGRWRLRPLRLIDWGEFAAAVSKPSASPVRTQVLLLWLSLRRDHAAEFPTLEALEEYPFTWSESTDLIAEVSAMNPDLAGGGAAGNAPGGETPPPGRTPSAPSTGKPD
jgi:hypothetical protein